MQENNRLDKINFNHEVLDDEYLGCSFINCDFSNIIIGNIYFEDCEFISCNFSLTKLNNTNFSNARFIDCKMTGMDFTKGSSFCSYYFEKSNLQYSNFYALKLKGISFTLCNLQEATFENANLNSSIFRECDLLRTIFINTNLEKANLSTSYNFIIDPQSNNIRKATFSKNNILGLVLSFGINIED